MPRYRRRTVPGALVHLISRIVNREHRIDDDARTDYLARVGRVAPHANWQLLGYALMSNHIHWLLRCLGAPVRDFIHPLHSGFGHWLNRRDSRPTPVFAERPRTYLFEPHETGPLLAYIHNNPVRAGVVTEAAGSGWSSHRAYIGKAPAPPWLDVEAGLELCELALDYHGRVAFDVMVRSVREQPRDPLYAGDPVDRARRDLRRQLNAPVELATPGVHADCLELPLVGTEQMPISEPWDGSMDRLLGEVCRAMGLRRERVQSRSRERCVARARRLLIMTAARHLGRSITEASAAVGVSTSAGSKLLRREATAGDDLEGIAIEIAARLRDAG